MLDIKQIENLYPEHVRAYKRNMLREYVQYKILEIIFDSKFGEKLSFMGGTSIRIVHFNLRFSEDLDFDNLGLTRNDFEEMAALIKKKLEQEGCVLETKTVFGKAYRCYIKIAGILFDNNISRHKEEKLIIQLDTEPQEFKYVPEHVIINRFDVFLRIKVVPVDILLSQKLYAIFNRKRPMGRDFYDVIFLLQKSNPNFEYLNFKLNITKMSALKEKLLLKCGKLNFKEMAIDLEPFLYVPGDTKKVTFFCDYIRSL